MILVSRPDLNLFFPLLKIHSLLFPLVQIRLSTLVEPLSVILSCPLQPRAK